MDWVVPIGVLQVPGIVVIVMAVVVVIGMVEHVPRRAKALLSIIRLPQSSCCQTTGDNNDLVQLRRKSSLVSSTEYNNYYSS